MTTIIEDSWVLVGKEEGKQMRFELEHTEDVTSTFTSEMRHHLSL